MPHPFIVILEGELPEYFETLEAAEEYAYELMADMRAEAGSDGEWHNETRIQIFRVVKTFDLEADADGFADYAEKPLPD